MYLNLCEEIRQLRTMNISQKQIQNEINQRDIPFQELSYFRIKQKNTVLGEKNPLSKYTTGQLKKMRHMMNEQDVEDYLASIDAEKTQLACESAER